tara:strand:- start:1538 stop:1894 length:357 start_codon:yes stop_codon:yes gene_type:complete
MKKSFAKFLMYLTGLYALLGYAMLLIWFIGVMLNLLFGEVSFLPSFLFNMISIIEMLMASGMVGFITSLVLVGQFFLAYHASSVFKRLSKIDSPYTTKEREEYFTYLFLVAIFVIYVI